MKQSSEQLTGKKIVKTSLFNLIIFTATSTGRLEGLLNTYRGACYSRNMRLILRVCCEYSSIDDTENGKFRSTFYVILTQLYRHFTLIC